jgi:hypothetical protein
MNAQMTDCLRTEYETIVSNLPTDATDEQIVHALVEHGDWTERGARAVVMLAREYGVFVLRNALALAQALNIEDGASRI